MPTFEQIESLQTQCYIHNKSGWEISEYQNMIFDESECLILISFSKSRTEITLTIPPKLVSLIMRVKLHGYYYDNANPKFDCTKNPGWHS
jgi:hypothetical protein